MLLFSIGRYSSSMVNLTSTATVGVPSVAPMSSVWLLISSVYVLIVGCRIVRTQFTNSVLGNATLVGSSTPVCFVSLTLVVTSVRRSIYGIASPPAVFLSFLSSK